MLTPVQMTHHCGDDAQEGLVYLAVAMTQEVACSSRTLPTAAARTQQPAFRRRPSVVSRCGDVRAAPQRMLITMFPLRGMVFSLSSILPRATTVHPSPLPRHTLRCALPVIPFHLQRYNATQTPGPRKVARAVLRGPTWGPALIERTFSRTHGIGRRLWR
ncbi:hypothetical protein CC85DRAFT_41842 [Cutaneotrichosporon oleaginosum]|uniref:Uncharacterized protein n=1 Tax=Cutaneotrichosporon oleaginosum TaxID=879819 RepID=A0A0J0XRB6_9TREE|nr:uncharacterized protein CC85DRAFT_41842 [Cutaneotrichosporon oleaginosum]KLT43681.1 hypothetical protein CC85DRAFT_41842 [Cutaneotrichosporon oleaginosum]TXT05100.1 hypothetical protein COLE_06420 [Cutaneotrichosporon oleaginosum]